MFIDTNKVTLVQEVIAKTQVLQLRASLLAHR
jgi:hypothetical protein